MALNKDKSLDVNSVIENTKTNLIKITEDKLVLILTQHVEKLTKNHDYLSLLALSATILITLFTADFRMIWFLSPDFIEGIFAFAFALASIYTYRAWKRSRDDKDSVERIMKDVKSQEE